MSGYLTIALKETRDHLRDLRALRTAALYALMGPGVIFLVSQSSIAQKGGAALLVAMMSVFALVAAFTGGMFIAIDTTAGERERGSLVPLLLNPVSRRDVVVGKWISVSIFALAGLALTLGAFTLVFELGGIEPRRELTAVLLLWIVCGLVPLALFGAALDVLTGAGAKTLKDAQARLSMVTFAPMVVGMFLIFFPNPLGRWWFTMPVVGQQALIGVGLRGEAVSIVEAVVLAALTLVATVLVLLAATRIMNRNEIIAN
jgi:sodium transport system permease protein